jgi:hypothetical protein
MATRHFGIRCKIKKLQSREKFEALFRLSDKKASENKCDARALLAMTNRTWLKIGLRILIIGVVCLNIIRRWLKALIKGSISFGSRQCRVKGMLDDKLFEEIKGRCEGFYRLSHHDKSHVERVYRLALRIAEGEGGYVDLDVIKAAVLLHDVARAVEDGVTFQFMIHKSRRRKSMTENR